MMTPLHQLPARQPDSDLLNVVVETPKGCRNKYKYDEGHGLWRLSKVLPLGASFPFDFGFIPSTRGEDGDPLDVLVLLDEPAFPGCVVPARLIGILEAEQTQGGKTIRNDRLVAVIETPSLPFMAWAAQDKTGRVTTPFVPQEAIESVRLNRDMDVPGALEIPLTYRNGRRALLTLSKGATGTDAFNKVIGEWTARGDLSSNQ